MYIYLVRHGEAEPRNGFDEKVLSEKGLAQAAAAAKYIKAQSSSIAFQILSSPKLRARQTAEMIREELIQQEKVIISPELLPESDHGGLHERITLKDNNILVGHLPFLDKLASDLINIEDADKNFVFTPAAVICLLGSIESGFEKKWQFSP